jgi:hypothetical protein
LVVPEGSNVPFAPVIRRNQKRRFDGSDQSNEATQVQDITVDQDSGDVMLWIDGSAVSIGSINTGNTARVSASQSAKQKNS